MALVFRVLVLVCVRMGGRGAWFRTETVRASCLRHGERARGRWGGARKTVLLWTGFEPARLSPAELKSASLDHSDTIALDGVEPGTTHCADGGFPSKQKCGWRSATPEHNLVGHYIRQKFEYIIIFTHPMGIFKFLISNLFIS